MIEKLICFALAASLLLTGCGSKSPAEGIGDALGIDLTDAELVEYDDAHGGFHGDGYTFAVLEKPGDIGEELAREEGWKSLPFPQTIGDLVAQTTEGRIPQVENGAYFFYDRHSQAEDPYDPSQINSRSSWNYTLAVYDADTQTIYYFECDT